MSDNPEIICHLERNLPFTAFDCLWIPSSARFVSVGCDSLNRGYLGIYELSRGAIQVVREEKKSTSLRCATFGAASLEDRHLATGDFGGCLEIWDLERLTSPVVAVEEAHRQIVNCIDGAGLHDGGSKLIATGSRDGFVKIWDPRDPSKASASIGPEEGDLRRDCWSVAFGRHPHDDGGGRLLAAGYDNGDLKLFDLRRMDLLWEKKVEGGICSLEFDGNSPSANKIVAATTNAKIHVCHSLKPETMVSCGGHDESTIWCVSHLRRNSNIFMTAGGDGNLNLWRHDDDGRGGGGRGGAGGDGNLNLWRHDDGRSQDAQPKAPNHSSKAKGVLPLNTLSLSDEATCRFSWHPDKTGLGLAASFDRVIRIVVVTRLSESGA